MENQTHCTSGVRRVSAACAGATLGLLVAELSLARVFNPDGRTPPGRALVVVGFACAGALLMLWRAGPPKPGTTVAAPPTKDQVSTLAARGFATTAAAGVGQILGWQLLLHLSTSFAYEGSLLFVWLPMVLASAGYVMVGRVMRGNGNASTFAGAGGVLLVPLSVLASLFGLFVFVIGQLLQY